eukprot:GFUD01064825.1.p1 GENE.GFUD01064825.1~~GFUD01064825.1.p1  ORF type:complete len:158 (+),score=60.87 GFUD01064825.1:60-476(+)
MELGNFVERLQNQLVINGQKLEDIDSRRKELPSLCQEEQDNISVLCSEVQARVGTAGEALKGKTVAVYTKLDQELSSTREEVMSERLILCMELERINELAGRGDENKIDLDQCCERVKEILSVCQFAESSSQVTDKVT